jgi:hypothetical protein
MYAGELSGTRNLQGGNAMKGVILGLVTGLVLGAAGAWLFVTVISVNPLKEELDSIEKIARASEEKVSDLTHKEEVLRDEKLKAEDELRAQLSVAEERLGNCADKLTESKSRVKTLEEQNKQLSGTVKAYKEKCGELVEETAEKKPADPDEEYRKKIQELFERITPVGGPLNQLAIKELGLDEGQVEGINDLLKDEAARMRTRLLDWASGLIKDKTPGELGQLSDLKLAYEIGRCVSDEIEQVQKLKPEQLRTLHIENHFVKFLPKDAKLVKIARSLYEERKKTYGGLAAYLSEEQEKAFKDKYLQSGTFIFPGSGSFGIGKLSDEDFEE